MIRPAAWIRAWIRVVALCVALGVALGSLYVRSRSHDPSHYMGDVILLREFRQLDAQWELDASKLRAGVLDSYDVLVDPPIRMQALLDALETRLAARGTASPEPGIAIAELRRAAARKATLMEDFKSHNAVLRNSLSFLPTAADEALREVEAGDGPSFAKRALRDRINEVLLDSIVFSRSGAADPTAGERPASLTGAVKSSDPPGASSSARLALFDAHVATVWREHALVGQLVQEIGETPIGPRSDDLSRQLDREEQRAASLAEERREQIFFFAAALTLLLVYAAIRLARSHAEVRRVNQQLVSANSTLEEKVNERTVELRHLATHDPLTGLPNRALLMDRLAQALAFSRRDGTSFAVAAIDLDRFKWVNDNLGHGAGDALLRVVSERIRGVLGPTDTLARIGGDEFVALLPAPRTVDDAVALLARIVEVVATPVTLNGQQFTVSCSVGCAVSPADGLAPDELLQAADAAMYAAKQSGRNTLQICNADLCDRVAEDARLETDLRQAIERGELSLVYQPQIDLRSGALHGFEALLRWQHPVRGAVPPGTFIPIAESCGLIGPIGEWVLDAACSQMREWIDAGLGPVRVAVNLSAKQLARPGLESIVQRCLRVANVDPSCLELELTETASMDDPERTIPLLERLKALGVSLSLDDFGTGYSNMQYLTRLPIDTLKLDGSFVRDITSDPGKLAIAEAIISMAHRLALRVVAEMTETEGQIALLGTLHCDLAQGYYFSKPLTPAQCRDLLRAGRVALPARMHRRPDVRTVLVLDDNAVVTTALAEQLRARGYRVLVANHVRDAFELLARHDVDVVMSDQCMPDTTGVDFLAAVKGLHPDVTRLIFSATDDFGAAVEAINQGAVHKFLRKPLQHDDVQDILGEIFERRNPGDKRPLGSSPSVAY
jgi:diguanylate cyclase (GGDEF)-like protein